MVTTQAEWMANGLISAIDRRQEGRDFLEVHARLMASLDLGPPVVDGKITPIADARIREAMGTALLDSGLSVPLAGRKSLLSVDWIGLSEDRQHISAHRIAAATATAGRSNFVRGGFLMASAVVERQAVVDFFGGGDLRSNPSGMPDIEHVLRAGLGAAAMSIDGEGGGLVSARAGRGRFLGSISQIDPSMPPEARYLMFDARPVHALPERELSAYRPIDRHDARGARSSSILQAPEESPAGAGQVSIDALTDGSIGAVRPTRNQHPSLGISPPGRKPSDTPGMPRLGKPRPATPVVPSFRRPPRKDEDQR